MSYTEKIGAGASVTTHIAWDKVLLAEVITTTDAPDNEPITNVRLTFEGGTTHELVNVNSRVLRLVDERVR